MSLFTYDGINSVENPKEWTLLLASPIRCVEGRGWEGGKAGSSLPPNGSVCPEQAGPLTWRPWPHQARLMWRGGAPSWESPDPPPLQISTPALSSLACHQFMRLTQGSAVLASAPPHEREDFMSPSQDLLASQLGAIQPNRPDLPSSG